MRIMLGLGAALAFLLASAAAVSAQQQVCGFCADEYDSTYGT